MKITTKQFLIAAAVIIVAASVMRSCVTRRAPSGDTAAPVHSTEVRPARGSGGAFSWFFDWFSGGDAQRETAVESPPESGDEQPRMTSELNDLSEKIEKAEKLPESVWYPNSTNREDVEKHSAILREFFLLGNMVRGGAATPEQKEKYLELKMRILQDKVDMIRQFQDKAGDTGDREEGDTMVRRLEQEVSRLKEELRKL